MVKCKKDKKDKKEQRPRITTQEGVDAFYRKCMDRADHACDEGYEAWCKGLDKAGATSIICDWKEVDCAVNALIGLMTQNGFTVLRNPGCEGTDSYGWIVFEPKTISRPSPKIKV